MAFNINDVGSQICYIRDDPKMKNIKISVDADDKGNDTFTQLEIKDGEFQVIPNSKTDRSTWLIAGSEGVGKSIFTSRLVIEYAKLYPKNKIYLFSEKEYDKCLDDIKNMNRIDITDIENDPISYQEFANALVIFDDCDALDTKRRKAIDLLRDKLLKNARDLKTSVIVTVHTFSGKDLQPALINCKNIVFFLQDWNKSLKYMIDNYIGLSLKDIKKLKEKRSRWTVFIKTYPQCLIQEKQIIMRHMLEETKEL